MSPADVSVELEAGRATSLPGRLQFCTYDESAYLKGILKRLRSAGYDIKQESGPRGLITTCRNESQMSNPTPPPRQPTRASASGAFRDSMNSLIERFGRAANTTSAAVSPSPRLPGISFGKLFRSTDHGEVALLPRHFEFSVDVSEFHHDPRFQRAIEALRISGYAVNDWEDHQTRSLQFRFEMDPQRHAENLLQHYGHQVEPRRYPSPSFTEPSDLRPYHQSIVDHRLQETFRRLAHNPAPPSSSPPAAAPAAPKPLPYIPTATRKVSA